MHAPSGYTKPRQQGKKKKNERRRTIPPPSSLFIPPPIPSPKGTHSHNSQPCFHNRPHHHHHPTPTKLATATRPDPLVDTPSVISISLHRLPTTFKTRLLLRWFPRLDTAPSLLNYTSAPATCPSQCPHACSLATHLLTPPTLVPLPRLCLQLHPRIPPRKCPQEQ